MSPLAAGFILISAFMRDALFFLLVQLFQNQKGKWLISKVSDNQRRFVAKEGT